MALTFRKLHPHFVAEVGPVDLRTVHDPETLAGIRAAMDEHAVLVFHEQPFADDEHLEFAQRLDGVLHTKLGSHARAASPCTLPPTRRGSSTGPSPRGGSSCGT